MLLLLLESALRALVLALITGLGLKVFRVRNPNLELTAWTVILLAALAMPALMQVSPLTIPVPAAVMDVIPEAVDLVEDSTPTPALSPASPSARTLKSETR